MFYAGGIQTRDLKRLRALNFCAQNKAKAGAMKQVSGAGQTWAAPNTLAQLMDVLKTPSKDTGGQPLRIIAGNTGSGIIEDSCAASCMACVHMGVR